MYPTFTYNKWTVCTSKLNHYLLLQGIMLFFQELKKVQNQVPVGQENLFVLRPSSSSKRLSDRSLNGGFNNATPVNKKSSLGIQQLGPTPINTPQQSISFLKESKKEDHRKILSRSRFAFHPGDDSTSVVSSFSGPFSP